MQSETKQCQNCKKDFTIEPDDFAFYEKIKVPAPTWCPDCRMMRRMQWMNYRTWYNWVLDGKSILSIYPPDSGIKIMPVKDWWSDSWDPMQYGQDYDLSRPFLVQFGELYKKVPKSNMRNSLENINCDYCNDTWSSKNCYLSITSGFSEDCYYSTAVIKCKDAFNCYWLMDSDRCYGCLDTNSSSNCLFCQNTSDCISSTFLFDCRNCSNCIACVGLRNAKYCMFNEQHSKEDYDKFVAKNLNGSYSELIKLAQKFEEFRLTKPVRYANIMHSKNVSGDNIYGAKNAHHCFDLTDQVENVKYVSYAGLGLKDSYDGYNLGSVSELLYECLDSGSQSGNIKFSGFNLYSSFNNQYCDLCSGSSELFGCVGLRSKKYCILNKQYTKEEYEALVPKIIEHMNEMPYVDKKGRIYKYGEFFPAELSPFAYNETVAQQHYPLTKEQAEQAGYKWRDFQKKDYKISLDAKDLADNIKDIKNNIVDEVIGCVHNGECQENCSGAFKITKRELDFHKSMNLPPPRLCPNCRYTELFKKRNPYRLWHRKCMKEGCSNKFETSYAPDRPEIVYCESCYQKEVY